MFESTYETIQTVVTVLSVFLQFYVFYLIQAKSPKSMSEYKYFLNLFMFFDCAFTVVMGLGLQAQPLSPFLASAMRGLCAFAGGNACNYTAAAGIYTGACSLQLQFYCLIYRCCVILPNKNIHRHFMSYWFRCFALTYGTAVSSVFSYMFYQTLVAPEEILTHPSIQFDKVQVELKPNEVILLIDVHRPITKTCIVLILMILAVGEILTIILALWLLCYLSKSAERFTKATYRLHLQFTILINFQIFSPMFLVVIPLTLYIVLISTGHEGPQNQIINEVGLVCLTIYGTVNASFTVFFISPYRAHAMQLLRPLGKLFPSVLGNKSTSNSAPVSSIGNGLSTASSAGHGLSIVTS